MRIATSSRFTHRARPAAGLLWRVAPLFIAWRVSLWLAGGLGLWYSRVLHPVARLLSPDGAIVERSAVARELGWRIFVAGWVQWDSRHYLSIARDGYSFAGQRWPTISFFPLYPLLIRVFAPLCGNRVELAAVVVANLALCAALLLLYDLLTLDFGPAVAQRSLVLLLVFPMSVFLGAAYSESLALLLVVAAVWALRRERWWLAGAAGFLLTLARLPGIFIAPILALAHLQAHGWRARRIRAGFLAVLLPPAALALFMLYQWQRFGTPWAFMIAQRAWDNSFSPPWVMPRRLLEALRAYPEWPITAFELVVWAVFIVLTGLALARLPWIYGVTALLLVLPPYLSSWYRSLPRHVMLAFPTFVVLALLLESPWIRRLLIATMALLLAVAAVLFVNGFWVA